MKITNAHGLPQVLVDAVINDSYDAGDSDISVTTLLQPPRKVALTKKHNGDLTEDASDRMWALMGQAMHSILERAGDAQDRIIERRFYGEMEGWKISGQVDLIEKDVLSDYKFMSVWEIIYGLKEEKAAQLNMLKWLAEGEGVFINKLQIVGMLRDWQKVKAKTDKDYPQAQIQIIDVPVWDENKTADYISQRVLMHQAATHELPLCTEEDRWYSGSKYAVMKKGRKSALRLLDAQDEAEQWMADNPGKGGDSIDFRPGENKRCADYCSVASVCQQYQEILNG